MSGERVVLQCRNIRNDSGPERVEMNEIPMFRYNTYFGINTVHYLDLMETSDALDLPMPKIILSALLTKLAKAMVKTKMEDRSLKPLAEDLFNQLGSLKFIAYVGTDGFPVLVPVIQCQAADSRRLVFYPMAFQNELLCIPKDTTVAVFGLTMKMEDVLVRGAFQGFNRIMGLRFGTIDIEWVYNAMPPAHGQIYPEVALEPIVDFN